MIKWEVEALVEDGHEFPELRVFDVLSDTESGAVLASYAAMGETPVRSVGVRALKDGEMSRSEILRDAIENGFKMLTPPSKEYK